MIYQLATVKKLTKQLVKQLTKSLKSISVSYTTGGMTITAAQYNATGLANTAGAEQLKDGN